MAKRNVIVSDLAKNYFPGRVCFNLEKMPIKVRRREICLFQMSGEQRRVALFQVQSEGLGHFLPLCRAKKVVPVVMEIKRQ